MFKVKRRIVAAGRLQRYAKARGHIFAMEFVHFPCHLSAIGVEIPLVQMHNQNCYYFQILI